MKNMIALTDADLCADDRALVAAFDYLPRIFSQSQLAMVTGVQPRSAYQRMLFLAERGLARKAGTVKTGMRGRPELLWRLTQAGEKRAEELER
jgi:predicted ArsR family transcriptional regulator